MLNPFFLQGSITEQGLVQDLINEQLTIYGVEVYYLPREYATEKTVIKEVVESKFSNAYPLEAYVDNYDGYGGQGTLLSKFGIQEVDDLTLIISKERYETYIEPLIKDLPNTKLTSRPKEGDLIYFPLGDRIFEIKYVEHEKPFYQLRKNYVYELRCELFRYQDEIIDTDVEFIDDNISDIGYIQTLQLVGIGTTANAITSVVDGGIQYVQITNRGSFYTSAPAVSFSRVSSGTTAVGIATMISNIIDFCNVDPNDKRVQGVELTNPGSGYTESPMVAFTGGEGSGAEATAYIGDGVVGVITVTNGGSGYTSPPTVTIDPPVGDGAAATASISGLGTVNSVTVTAGGTSYSQTNVPSVTFSAAPSGVVSAGIITASGAGHINGANYNTTGGSGTGFIVQGQGSGGMIGFTIVAGGSGYVVGDVVQTDTAYPASIEITGVTTYTTAEGTAIVGSSGTITSINITNAGTGYTTAPTVSIANSAFNKVYGTNNAGLVKPIATSLINSSGIVTAINISNAGLGYTGIPTITISAPQSVTGVGTFVYNETVTGSASSTTAIVKSWNVVTKVLEVSNITGTFTPGEELTGSESGAVYTLKTQNTDNLEDEGDSSNKYGKYEDNYNIENEADAVIDFTETNPFGTP